jgi:shikimate kinase
MNLKDSEISALKTEKASEIESIKQERNNLIESNEQYINQTKDKNASIEKLKNEIESLKVKGDE